MPHITINLLPEDIPQPPMYFRTASACYPQSNIHYPEGSQKFYQILLVLSGTGTLLCQGKQYTLTPGCAFFTAQGQASEYRDRGGLTTAFLTARGDAFPALLQHYGISSFLFAQKVNTEKYLSGIQAIIQEYYTHKRAWRLSAMTYSFYVDFFEEQTGAPPTPLEQICLYIEAHFATKLTLPALAAVGGISVSKLCHDFRKAYGCTVFAYILNLRLTYGRKYLQTTRDARTKDAALFCGFQDVGYFCKAYKKKFGETPSASGHNRKDP